MFRSHFQRRAVNVFAKVIQRLPQLVLRRVELAEVPMQLGDSIHGCCCVHMSVRRNRVKAFDTTRALELQTLATTNAAWARARARGDNKWGFNTLVYT